MAEEDPAEPEVYHAIGDFTTEEEGKVNTFTDHAAA